MVLLRLVFTIYRGLSVVGILERGILCQLPLPTECLKRIKKRDKKEEREEEKDGQEKNIFESNAPRPTLKFPITPLPPQKI